MRVLAAFALAALAAAAVTDLTPDNFDEIVGKDKGVFVKFFAPWCGHCKAMAADYETVAATFKASDPVVIAEVNADSHKDLASRFGVRGYPTLKWFPAGASEPEDYSGGRTADDIIEFVNKNAGTARRLAKAPSAVLDLSPATFDAAITQGDAVNKVRLVEFFAPWCGHCKQLAPTYEKVGAAFDGESKVVVAKVDADKHRSLGERFGVTGFPTIKLWRAGATEPEDYSGGRDGEAFMTALNTAAGTHRRLDGSLGPEAGRIAAFDDLAAKFVAAGDKDAKTAVLGEAKAAAAALETADAKANADIYVKAMTRALDKGDAWFAKEATRLEGMAASESIARAQKYAFLTRKNVLAAFTA